jgi:methylated-DNA-[protein]-cysteine S-methyltransferase
MIDVSYGFADSPFGPLLVAVTPVGLATLAYPDHTLDAVMAGLARNIPARPVEAPRATDAARRQLDEYFDGRRLQFDMPIDWTLSRPGFTRRVLQHTWAIPYGHTRTYKDLAEQAGIPHAARAAGSALGSNPIPIVVPCHRVVMTGGGLGGYTGGLERKVALLTIEGVLHG